MAELGPYPDPSHHEEEPDYTPQEEGHIPTPGRDEHVRSTDDVEEHPAPQYEPRTPVEPEQSPQERHPILD